MKNRRYSRNASCVLCAFSFAAAACAATDRPDEQVIIRDSAGIRIVDNLAPLLPKGTWAVSADPTIVIGAIESELMHNLYYVEGAVALSDGTIVVANSPAPMLRWFDPSGNFLRGAGRPGGGPGEFGGGESAYISALWPLGNDSVATWEHSARRMQVFDSRGEYVRSIVIEVPPAMPLGAFPQVLRRSEAGFLASLRADDRQGPAGVRRRKDVRYILYHPDGTFARTLAILPGDETMIFEAYLPGRSTPARDEGSPPFAKHAQVALYAERFYYGSADTYEIAHYNLDGTLRELIRKRVPNRELTLADIHEHRERARARAAERQVPRSNPAPGESPYPHSLPAYRRLHVDRGGSLWVEEYDSYAALATWSVFDPWGRWVTDINMPTGLRIYDIGDDYILAEKTSEFDVETVIKFGLSRRH